MLYGQLFSTDHCDPTTANSGMSSSEVYLTAQEAAEYLRSSPSTLAKLRLSGNGPVFTRIGKAIRYRRIDLDGWMQSRLVRSTSDQIGIARQALVDDSSAKAETK